METKVYYGEYSLEYWIKILLNKDIQIPEYQRSFVWNETMVRKLLDSLKDGQFVPPVTIGGFRNPENHKLVNYLIDGQQRLTSLLIAYLKRFPNREEFKNDEKDYGYDGPAIDEDTNEEERKPMKWTLTEFQNYGKTKSIVQNQCTTPKYYEFSYLDQFEDPKFLKTHYIGFSYIVPKVDSDTEQQKFYSRLFRDINIQGNKLLPQESRRALYFMQKDLTTFFEPGFLDFYGLTQVKTLIKLDFVRYLSFTTNYAYVGGQLSWIARGYWRDYEPFYERFVFSIVQDEEDDYFGKFSDRYAEGDVNTCMRTLSETIKLMNLDYAYQNYIAMDMWFFGLIYQVVVMHRHIDMTRLEQLKNDIKEQISLLLGDEKYCYAPNMVTKIRGRMQESINIYERYLLD